MNEYFIIKNFGPIKDVFLELKKFNVLIGEQATGKSTVAKLLAVCRYFSYIANDQGVFNYPNENHFLEGLKSWGLNDSIKEDSYIEYKWKHYKVVVQYIEVVAIEHDEEGNAHEHKELLFLPKLSDCSNEFNALLSELEKLKPKSDSGLYDFTNLFWTIPTSFFQNDVASLIDNPFYLPTERGLQSIFSLGKNSIPNINDALFNQFANLDQIARQFSKGIEIEPLNVVYKNDSGRGYVRKKDQNSYYSLSKGASGFQSAIPVVLVVKYYSEIRKKVKTLLIEEPELNLFPLSQDKLVRFLVDKCVNNNISMLLTTHSPYILTSLNNLMYAYQIGKDNMSKVERIVERRYWVNPEDVSAYMLLPNGTCESIIDSEGLIKAEKIDSVSAILNEDFNAIMDIEINDTK